MTTSSPHRLRTVAIPLAVLALAGCGESTTSFDPVALSQSTDAVLTAMEGNPALQSIGVLGDKMTVGTASGAPAGSPSAFPPGVPGTTFVYDVAQQKYVASDREGAPANGVRFILYAVPLTGEPREIGYLDLLDQTPVLRVQAFLTGSTSPALDYTASAAIQESGGAISSATLGARGSVSSASLTLSLDTATQTYSSTAGISMRHKVSVPEEELSIDLEASISLRQMLQGSLTLVHGGNTTVVTGSGTLSSFSGNITHNGAVVITFSGPSSDPVFLLASGDQPPTEQLAALRKLSEFTSELPCVVANLLKPAAKLFTPTVPSLPCS